MKFHLYGNETTIQIDVLNRNFPNSNDYWDGNWVTSNVNMEIPGYCVSFVADLRTDELRDFLNELQTMNTTLKGKTILKNLDSFLHFEAEIDKLGKVKWSIETQYLSGYGAILNFQFKSDQSYLPKLIKELEDILLIYPVIGKP